MTKAPNARPGKPGADSKPSRGPRGQDGAQERKGAAAKGGEPKKGDGRRDGRRGDGRKGDKGRGDATRGPSRVATTRVVVEKLGGARIVKTSTVDRDTHKPIRVVYAVEFDGHKAIEFAHLSAARQRAKEAPPELPATGGASAEPSAETAETGETAGTAEATA